MAERLNSTGPLVNAVDLVAVARSFLGTRFRHQGRRKGVGVDCIGLVGMTALHLGLPGAAEWRAEPRYHNYGLPPDPGLLLEACDRFLDRIALAAVGLGDILVMRFADEPQHFALISRIDPVYIVHAYSMDGVRRVCEQGVAVAGAKIVRAYRFRGLA